LAPVPPNGEFRILTPVTWQFNVDKYPGRLISSFEVRPGSQEFTGQRVARLPLPALLRSAKYNTREGDDRRSRWEEVALGDVTPATVARWIMSAGQDAMAKQMGIGRLILDQDVSESRIETSADGKSSVLLWKAVQSVNPASELNNALGPAPAPVAVSGKAILSNGVVTFTVITASPDRFKESWNGEAGPEYMDELVQSLEQVSPLLK
jgi:hypothetical protein